MEIGTYQSVPQTYSSMSLFLFHTQSQHYLHGETSKANTLSLSYQLTLSQLHSCTCPERFLHSGHGIEVEKALARGGGVAFPSAHPDWETFEAIFCVQSRIAFCNFVSQIFAFF